MEKIILSDLGSSGDSNWMSVGFAINDESINIKLANYMSNELNEDKLKDLVISNYYKFSSVHKSDEVYKDRSIDFSAKYDNSYISIAYNDDCPNSVTLNWDINPSQFESGSNNCGIIETEIKNQVLPELVTKILSLI